MEGDACGHGYTVATTTTRCFSVDEEEGADHEHASGGVATDDSGCGLTHWSGQQESSGERVVENDGECIIHRMLVCVRVYTLPVVLWLSFCGWRVLAVE